MMKNFSHIFHFSKIFINPLSCTPQHINNTPKVIHSLKTPYRLITSTTTTTTGPYSFPQSKYSHIPFSNATKDYLNRLREQLHYYAVIEIRTQKFLITKNDLVITHRLRDVDIGDEIKLNRVLELGSKDYTIKGQPLVSEAFYSIKATVVEQPKGPFIEIFKKKRRNRHKKRITHKQTYTVLRISEVEINKLD
ncbi:ribosomal protein L21-like protein [Glomus cerebriforme]|uniref:Large ribosomal subunit protein bL21m n=1 Tax=Glomus cerebriforme TaxID=658196 RepID=A0A397SEB1_9GLOM|nr:ribosomal protein L21-like protein [Glomus cerebriforme]